MDVNMGLENWSFKMMPYMKVINLYIYSIFSYKKKIKDIDKIIYLLDLEGLSRQMEMSMKVWIKILKLKGKGSFKHYRDIGMKEIEIMI